MEEEGKEAKFVFCVHFMQKRKENVLQVKMREKFNKMHKFLPEYRYYSQISEFFTCGGNSRVSITAKASELSKKRVEPTAVAVALIKYAHTGSSPCFPREVEIQPFPS